MKVVISMTDDERLAELTEQQDDLLRKLAEVRRQIGIVQARLAASHQRERKRQRDDRFRDRNEAIVLMRDSGMTLREIAREVGLSQEQVRVVLARAWRAAQPLEGFRPHDRIYRFAPSTRAGHVICRAVMDAQGEIPGDICPESAARAVARLTRNDVLGRGAVAFRIVGGASVGRKTLAEIEAWLAEYGLQLC
jgi:hypothetical protein